MPQQYSTSLNTSESTEKANVLNSSTVCGSSGAFLQLNDTIYEAFHLIQENPNVDVPEFSIVQRIEEIKEVVNSIKAKNGEISRLSDKLLELDSEFRSALLDLMDVSGFDGLSKRSYKKQDVKKLISQNLTPKMTAILEETNGNSDQLRLVLTERDSALEDMMQKINLLDGNQVPELIDKLALLCAVNRDNNSRTTGDGLSVLERSALLLQYGDREGVHTVTEKEVVAVGEVDSD